jgi:hypothetical protein
VRVHIDDAGRDQEPIGIDGSTCPLRRHVANGADEPVIDCHVGGARWSPRPIDHGATTDNEVVHLVPP